MSDHLIWLFSWLRAWRENQIFCDSKSGSATALNFGMLSKEINVKQTQVLYQTRTNIIF